jgi:hypothetical protein
MTASRAGDCGPDAGSDHTHRIGVGMTIERIQSRGRAANDTTEFARIAASIDEAEALAGGRAGGPTLADQAAIRLLEAKLPRPAGAGDWEWLAKRLARALENGWQGTAAYRLIRLAA